MLVHQVCKGAQRSAKAHQARGLSPTDLEHKQSPQHNVCM